LSVYACKIGKFPGEGPLGGGKRVYYL